MHSHTATERLHITLRERNKAKRAWNKVDIPLSNGQKVCYNFVRPYMTLGDKTPIPFAQIEVVNGQNKWKELRKNTRGPINQSQMDSVSISIK